MKSVDHRGTPDFPGRTVTLVKDENEEELFGCVYEYSSPAFFEEHVLEALDVREKHGYTRTVAEVTYWPNGDESAAPVVEPCYVYYFS